MRYLLTITFLICMHAPRCQTLGADLDAIAVQRGLVGASVAAFCGETSIISEHTGVRRIPGSLPVTDETRYRIASISKLVTAIGLMKLFEQDQFGLDDDVAGALGFLLRNPAYPDVPITYRMLLSHTSSIQDGTGYGPFLSATFSVVPPPAISEVVSPGGQWYTANMWRTEPPGTWFTYSNLNFGIIGTLIEAHSGQRFDDFMRNEVLLPMGISGSFNIQHLDDIDQLATLYRNSLAQADDHGGSMPPAPDLNGHQPGVNGLYFSPQGGLRCSALEIARVGMMLNNGGQLDGATILEPSTVAAMLGDEWTWNGNNGDNYFGLFRSWGSGVHRITAQQGGDVVLPNTFMVGHAGEAYGLISDLYLDPSSGFGLVFITNGYTPGNNYQLGNNSAFYRVEEEIFAAIATHAQPACIGTGIPPGQRDLLVVRDHGVVWQGTGKLYIDVHDLQGRSLHNGWLEPSGTSTMSVPGMVIIKGLDQFGGRHIVRIFTAH